MLHLEFRYLALLVKLDYRFTNVSIFFKYDSLLLLQIYTESFCLLTPLIVSFCNLQKNHDENAAAEIFEICVLG